jgi:hypothetical protein
MGSVIKLSKENLIQHTKPEIMKRLSKTQDLLFEFGITRIGDPAAQTGYRMLYQEACDTGILKMPVVLTRQLNTSMVVIPAEAGIQKGPGCRIKSGMTDVAYLIAGLITSPLQMTFGI